MSTREPLLYGYAAAFTKSVAGRSDDLSTTALEGGARIHFVLQDIFVKGLESLDPTQAGRRLFAHPKMSLQLASVFFRFPPLSPANS